MQIVYHFESRISFLNYLDYFFLQFWHYSLNLGPSRSFLIKKQDRQKRQNRREVKTSKYQIRKSVLTILTIPYYPEQSYSMQSNPVLSRAILCYLQQSYWVILCGLNQAILCYPKKSCFSLSSSVLSQAIPSHQSTPVLSWALFWAILCYPEQSFAILSNYVLAWVILFYP